MTKNFSYQFFNFFYLENNEILIACPDHVWIMWRLLHVPRHPRVLSLEIGFVMLICFIISFKTYLYIINKSAPVSFNIHAEKRITWLNYNIVSKISCWIGVWIHFVLNILSFKYRISWKSFQFNLIFLEESLRGGRRLPWKYTWQIRSPVSQGLAWSAPHWTLWTLRGEKMREMFKFEACKIRIWK